MKQGLDVCQNELIISHSEVPIYPLILVSMAFIFVAQ